MHAESPINDDPVIRRVAAMRPSIPEDDLSPVGASARAIYERVLAGDAPTPSRRLARRWARPRWTLQWMVLALAPVAAAAIVLVLAGTFSGPDSSGTQPAAAAVIRAAERALSTSPGTISVEDQTFVSGPSVHGHPYTLHTVQETPAGRAPQNYLTSIDGPARLDGNPHHPVSGTLYVGGTEEIYSPRTNTIYASSIWGPYLHPGRRPGSYVYRYAPGATVPTTRPVNVTASERRALLTGYDAVMETSKTIGGKVYLEGLKVRPVLRGPAQLAQTLREELENPDLHLVGRTTVDGRAAIEFAGKTTDATAPEEHLYFDPTTHLPFEEVDSVGTKRQQVIHIGLRTLPITPTTRRLLSLQTLHPTARVDRNHRDYVQAAHGLQVFNQ